MHDSPQSRLIAMAASDTLGLKGHLSPHFGRCHSWVLAEVSDEGIRSVRILANPLAGSHDCGQIAQLLGEIEVQEVVAGGLGRRAQTALQARGIAVATGFEGRVEDCLHAYLGGSRPPERLCDGSHEHADRAR